MKKSEDWKTKYGLVSTLSKKEINELENHDGEEVDLTQIIAQSKRKAKTTPIFIAR